MNSPETGLRETILTAASSLFMLHGYHGLAMRQISDAVGVSKAALYYHFKDKEELFIAILTINLNEIESAIEGIKSRHGTCSEQIVQFIEYVLNQPARQRAIIRLGSQEMAQLSVTARQKFNKTYHDQFIGKLKNIFQDGVARGEFRPIDPGIATWALLGIMFPYFYPAHTESRPLQPETIRAIIEIYMNGVSCHPTE